MMKNESEMFVDFLTTILSEAEHQKTKKVHVYVGLLLSGSGARVVTTPSSSGHVEVPRVSVPLEHSHRIPHVAKPYFCTTLHSPT